MDLAELRAQIDKIDAQMVSLFCRRMAAAQEVAEYKRTHHLPVLQADRERQVLERASSLAGDAFADYTKALFRTIMDLSKAQQSGLLTKDSRLTPLLRTAASTLPDSPIIACQGVEGAYSSIAARRLFPQGKLQFYQHFSDIFEYVKHGQCELGILPIENSTAGSVNSVYDLMRQHQFHIVRGMKLEVQHCLLAKPGVSFDEITDIYSHEQAISQCSTFLQEHPGIRVHLYSNTAAAARFVSECADRGIAAIASQECARIYRLSPVLKQIKNAERNYTRFIVISNHMIHSEDADRISIALTLPHEAGSLYRLISQFAMLDLNLTKLESRPLPNTSFEFLFYFDFTGSIADPHIVQLLSRLEQQCDYFVFLGNYHECE